MTYRQINTGDSNVDKAISAIYDILNSQKDTILEIGKALNDKAITDEKRFNLIKEQLDAAIQCFW